MPRPLPSSAGLECGPSCRLETKAWPSQTIVAQNGGDRPASSESWPGVSKATRAEQSGMAATRGNGNVDLDKLLNDEACHLSRSVNNPRKVRRWQINVTNNTRQNSRFHWLVVQNNWFRSFLWSCRIYRHWATCLHHTLQIKAYFINFMSASSVRCVCTCRPTSESSTLTYCVPGGRLHSGRFFLHWPLQIRRNIKSSRALRSQQVRISRRVLISSSVSQQLQQLHLRRC